MNTYKTNNITGWLGKTLTILPLTIVTIVVLTSQLQAGKARLQAGILECWGQGGWGALIASRKEFKCRFTSLDGKVKGKYEAVIKKFGIDIGKSGNTVISWMVLGPANKVGKDYVAGSLDGEYVGIGAEAALGIGLGANALFGGGADSFALQPISVQAQTGLNIAAGVQTFRLNYVGPSKD